VTGTGDGRRAALTLGPLLFNWPAAQRRDFYARIADEAPIDSVCLGEVVCAKRAPFSDPDLPEIARRLADGGKEVIYSTLALVMDDHDRALVAEIANASDMLVEANDLGAIEILAGRTHVIGPFVNVYNEGALAWFAQRGARRVSLPVELPAAAIGALGARAGAVELEVTAFGRLPLAISARCYHARARGLHKDGCRYVCDEDPGGLSVETLDGQGFLAVNGLQTLSHGVAALTAEIAPLRATGIDRFRLWPQAVDMVAVARAYRDLLDGWLGPEEAAGRLAGLVPFAPITAGFVGGSRSHSWHGTQRLAD